MLTCLVSWACPIPNLRARGNVFKGVEHAMNGAGIASVPALRATYRLNLSSDQVSESFNNLSTGYRINRSADGPVEYTNSQRITSDIRTLEKVQLNAQTGLSILETADSSLQTMQNHLLRIRELTVQTASDSMGPAARLSIGKEIAALGSEIDRLAAATEFNGAQLLDGSVTSALLQVGIRSAVVGNTVDVSSALTNSSTDLTGGGLGLVDSGATLTFTSLTDIYNGATNTTLLVDNTTARSFLGDIDGALDRINQRRAVIGAFQNRIDGTLNNLAATDEALQATRSKLRDTDIGREVSKLTQSQVRQEAASSVLAQINQFDRSVVRQLLSN